MNKRPYIQIWGEEFLAETIVLEDDAFRAYFRLVWAYWQQGGLPDNDMALSRIVGVDMTHWLEMRPSITPFFGPGWVSPKLDAKIQEMISTSERRADSGRKGGMSTQSKTFRMPTEAELQAKLEESKVLPFKRN
jgi:uncharacterized protein YdaU (DUF1376 family)